MPHQNHPPKSPEDLHWIKLVLNEMRYHIMSIIFMLILYLLLWVVPQINDLIVVINQADNDWIAVMVFFSSLSVLAFLISTVNTYFNPPLDPNEEALLLAKGMPAETPTQKPLIFHIPKDKKELYVEAKGEIGIQSLKDFQETQAEYIRRVFPKLLGTILILIAAFAVNNTYIDVYNDSISILGNAGLPIAIAVLLACLYQPWVIRITKWLGLFKWTSYIPIILAVGCLLAILFLGLLNQGGSRGDAVRLFYSLLLLALFFLLVSLSYNPMVLKLKKYVGAPLIILLVIGIFIAYLILFVNPEALKIITPLSIVMICIIGIYTLLNVVKLVGFRWNIPLLTMVVLAAIGLAVYNASQENFSHYDVSTTKMTVPPSDRMTLEAYIEQWIEDRREAIINSTEEDKFPIILVSSEGGGSRAGLWSFLVQSYLYDRNPAYFEKYMFSMTGASGGGGGNNMFYTQAYHLQNKTSSTPFKFQVIKKDRFHYRASSIYSKDYLSSSVASVMGRDGFKSITNLFTFKDRGALLEDEWERSFKLTFNYNDATNPLAKSYLDMMPQKGQYQYIRPLLITNTTHLQSGGYAVITPVCTSEDTHNMGVFLDLLAAYRDHSRMIKRSTAMSLNARFPYVSPAARIPGVGQFGDAGYYDNIGGTVTRRLEVALIAQLKKDSALVGKYDIKHLLITNYEAHQPINYSSQLTAPPSILWNATFAHPTEMEKTFSNVYMIESKRTEIKQDTLELQFMKAFQGDDHMIKPFIPLGRYLSESAVRSLEARLRNPEVISALNRLIPQKSEAIHEDIK